MTNTEKYLKAGADIEKIAREIDIILQNDVNVANAEQATIKYFNSTCKPTLTEDERVILRNMQNHSGLGRDEEGCLYFGLKKEGRCFVNHLFGHLFQFIKERRRI